MVQQSQLVLQAKGPEFTSQNTHKYWVGIIVALEDRRSQELAG